MDLAFDRKHEEHLDAKTLETVLNSLLARYPEAPAAALRHDGVSVAMPESVPLQRNSVLEARSGLDLVIHDDRVRLLTTWDRVLAGGAARCLVHLAGHPDTTVKFCGLDLRETHGVGVAAVCPPPRARRGGGRPEAWFTGRPILTPRSSSVGLPSARPTAWSWRCSPPPTQSTGGNTAKT